MPLPEWNDSFVLLGTVVRPHGIRGEVKVRPWTEQQDAICRYRRLFLAAEAGDRMLACSTVHCRLAGCLVILRIDCCTDRKGAEQLVGLHVWLPVSELPPAGGSEVYLHTLMGKQATTTTGQNLGTIKGMLSGKGQDVLVIGDGEREVLVPAVRTFIVTAGSEQVVFDLPPGLLDINC